MAPSGVAVDAFAEATGMAGAAADRPAEDDFEDLGAEVQQVWRSAYPGSPHGWCLLVSIRLCTRRLWEDHHKQGDYKLCK